jgi:hypothetical protein
MWQLTGIVPVQIKMSVQIKMCTDKLVVIIYYCIVSCDLGASIIKRKHGT